MTGDQLDEIRCLVGEVVEVDYLLPLATFGVEGPARRSFVMGRLLEANETFVLVASIVTGREVCISTLNLVRCVAVPDVGDHVTGQERKVSAEIISVERDD